MSVKQQANEQCEIRKGNLKLWRMNEVHVGGLIQLQRLVPKDTNNIIKK